jgi:hypothetical protein
VVFTYPVVPELFILPSQLCYLLKLLAGPPKPVRSRVREEAKNNPRRGNSDMNSPDAGSSDISSDMKHRTVDG